MNKQLLIFFRLAFCFYFCSSCVSESKMGLSIPAVPEVNEIARREAAIAFLTDAIDAYPNSSEIFYKRAILYLENEKTDEALEDINNAINLQSNLGYYFQAKALILKFSNQPQLALEAASKAEVLNAMSPELYTLLGDLYQQLGQFDKAKAYLRKSIKISPNNGETYFYLGEIAAKLADTTNALTFYGQALGLKPSFLPAYLKLIQVHNNLKQYDFALLYSREALKYHPYSAPVYFQRGNTYQKAWKMDSAVMCYNRAIALDTNLVQASFTAGIIYFKSRAYRLALPFFERTLKHNPNYPEVKFFVAQCSEYTGDYVRAEDLYNQILAVNNQDYKAMIAISRVQKKQLYGAYVANEELTYDSTSFPKFDILRSSSLDTNSLRRISPKGIK